jgi:hypothetical protein
VGKRGEAQRFLVGVQDLIAPAERLPLLHELCSFLLTTDDQEPTTNSIGTVVGSRSSVVDFLCSFRWQRDERCAADEGYLTPAVLGALVEQGSASELAAYYTSRDVSDYIARSTLIPALLDLMEEAYPAAFDPAGPFWGTLRSNPALYIPSDLAHAHSLALPPMVAAGINDYSQRQIWNELASPGYGLPDETWRELVARRERYVELCRAIATGQVTTINELVTRNLDGLALLEQVLTTTSDAELLLACWRSLQRITVLDPTCGAGAFLLTALQLLARVGLGCLRRLATPGDRLAYGTPPAALEELKGLVVQAGPAENWPAFIYASLLQHNLFGVDCSAEAVLVCRTRLLCATLAQAGTPPALPDLAGNIVQGNALIGYQKGALEATTLDQQLAGEYGIAPDDELAFAAWRSSHQPLHWEATFPHQMQAGGFGAILANPPYLAATKVRQQYRVRGYSTDACGNLYALVIERALSLLRAGGRCGFIVPIASLATTSMEPLQKLYAPYQQWHSHWAVRPGRLFANVDMNLTISLLHKTMYKPQRYTTGYRRWRNGAKGERHQLFTTLSYTALHEVRGYPKLGSPLERELLSQLESHGLRLGAYNDPQGTAIYYHSGGRYWRKALWQKQSSHYHPFVAAAHVAPIVFALLNSQLFYWYWIAYSNCMDVVSHDVRHLPVFALETINSGPFVALNEALVAAYTTHQRTRHRQGKVINGSEVNVAVAPAKPIIDAIDRLLGEHYGLSPAMVDFVLSYDKYRVRQ